MIQMKKSYILPLLILAFSIALVLVHKFVIDYSLSLELTKESIKVNMYDDINLEAYIVKASDSNGKNLRDKVKISVECDDEDILNGNNLYIKGIGPKVATYTVENKNRMVIKKLVIKVITDPNDNGFKPNYDKIESESKLNTEDVPSSGGSSELTEEQLKYLESF